MKRGKGVREGTGPEGKEGGRVKKSGRKGARKAHSKDSDFATPVIMYSLAKIEKSAQRGSFLGRTSRGHPGVIRTDIPAQNFGQGGQNSGKRTSILAQTSMTQRRGRPRP